MAEPVRTCVGCRAQAGRSALLRVVARNGALLPDPARREPGRGASLHPDLRCLDLALRRRAFGRALRYEGSLDAEPLRAWLAASLDRSAGADGSG